jgi:hypothetical protein
LDGIIHHVDEDRSNNSLENLRCGHLKCHTSYHQKGKPESDEHKAKMRAPRRPLSAATKAKISAARKGQRLSAETKAKISAARKSGNTNRKKK